MSASTYIGTPALDDQDAAIREKRAALLDQEQGPREGDYIEFADGNTRRVSHVWPADWHDDGFARCQTSEQGSWYLGNGGVSFSGSLYGSVSEDTLTLTEERRDGSVWFFHHDHHRAHNGIHTSIPFRVYRCTEEAPR